MGVADVTVDDIHVNINHSAQMGTVRTVQCSGWLAASDVAFDSDDGVLYAPVLTVTGRWEEGRVTAQLNPYAMTINGIELRLCCDGSNYFYKTGDGCYVEWSNDACAARLNHGGHRPVYSFARDVRWVDVIPEGTSIMDQIVELKYWSFKDVPPNTFYFLDLDTLTMIDLAIITPENIQDYRAAERG